MLSKIHIKCLRSIFIFLCFTIIIVGHLNAQSIKPGINFQAIAKDKAGNPANNRTVYIEASILKGSPNGAVVYGEYHTSNSNENGIFNIVIGKGERYIGLSDIYGIDWPSTKYYFHPLPCICCGRRFQLHHSR